MSARLVRVLVIVAAISVGAGGGVGRAEPLWSGTGNAPAPVIWGAKAAAATTFDAFIDFAIAAVLALPSPGPLDHAGNFLVNLVPYLGEAKKAAKVKKLLEMVDQVIQPIKKMQELRIPGAGSLLDRLIGDVSKLKDHIRKLDLQLAKGTFGRLLGHVREAQVATKLDSKGATIEYLGKLVEKNGQRLTDIDVVSREGQQLVLTQVKAGKAAVLTPGSSSWPRFEEQAKRTTEVAKALHADTGVMPKLRYVVDNITPEARTALEILGFTVELSGSFLR